MGDPINLNEVMKFAFEFLDAFAVEVAVIIAVLVAAPLLAFMFFEFRHLFDLALWGESHIGDSDGTYNADWEAEKERHGWK